MNNLEGNITSYRIVPGIKKLFKHLLTQTIPKKPIQFEVPNSLP